MGKIEKLITKIKTSQNDIHFSELEKLLNTFKYFKIRIKGSHAHFRKNGSPFLTIPYHNNKVKKVYILEIIKLLKI